MSRFHDVVAAITGAGGGIGRELSLEAARRGMRVAVADIRADAAEATATAVRQAGGQAQAYALDVTDRADWDRFAAEVESTFGGANLLMNNAAVYAGGGIDRVEARDFQWILEVNVMGPFHGCQVFLPQLKRAAQAGGLAHIVNTGSEVSIGLAPGSRLVAYTASKHALLGMTDCIRSDLKDTGIAVSLLCPGPVATEFWMARRTRHPRFVGPGAANPALGDMLAKYGQPPADVARIAFLGVEAGDFIIATDPLVEGQTQARARDVADAFANLTGRLDPSIRFMPR